MAISFNKTHRKKTLRRKPQPQLLNGTDPLIGLFIRSLSEYYPNDPTRPSLVIGWLPGKQAYYVSIVRYTEMYGRIRDISKQTIAQVTDPDLCCALNTLLKQWQNKLSPSKEATEKFKNLLF